MTLVPAGWPRVSSVSSPTALPRGISLLPLLLVLAGCAASGSVTRTTAVKGEASVGWNSEGDGGAGGGGGDGAADDGEDDNEPADPNDDGSTADTGDRVYEERPGGSLLDPGCPSLELAWRSLLEGVLVLGYDITTEGGALIVPWSRVEGSGTVVSTTLHLCAAPGTVVRVAASVDSDLDGVWDTHSCVRASDGGADRVGALVVGYDGDVISTHTADAPTSDGCELVATL
jgi:hypothetical protein